MSIVFTEDNDGKGIPAINIRLSVGHEDSDSALFDYDTDHNGTKGWPIPYWPWQDYTMHVNKRSVNPNYGSVEVYIPKPSTNDYGDVHITLPRISKTLEKIVVTGRDFFTVSGQKYMVIGNTDLLLACRYDLEGPDAILPVLAERRDLGFNNLRIFWQADIVSYRPDMHAWQMPLNKMGPFLSLCLDYGFYIEGTILQQCQVVNPNTSDQQRRVNDVRSATVGIINHFEQLGNEWDINGFDPVNFSRPNDRVAACASNKDPYGPFKWDYWSFSGRRDVPKAMMEYGPLEYTYGDYVDGKYVGNMPIFCGEGMKPGINSSDQRDYERAGAQARSGCGGRFHTEAGTRYSSRLFNGLEKDCARAFVFGMTNK